MKADVAISVTALTDRVRVMNVDLMMNIPEAVRLMRIKTKATFLCTGTLSEVITAFFAPSSVTPNSKVIFCDKSLFLKVS